MSSTVTTCNGEAQEGGRRYQAILVTVIVPCYNGAAFLAEALTSALHQTHSAVDVLVIDDGSTDTSPDIARSFPVRYIRQGNLGLSGARNTGISESKGEYLVFLDADDRLLPNAIASGLRALVDRPDCAMTVGDHAFVAADGAPLRKSAKKAAMPSAYEALLKSNFIEMISSVLFRRSVFDQVGVFNTALRVSEDYDLYLRIARVRPICRHSAVVAEYRMHAASVSHNSELMLMTTLQVLRSQQPYVSGNGGRRHAFRWGIHSWSKQYGRRLARELAASPSIASVDRLGHKLRTLARYYPLGLFMVVVLCMRPRQLRNLLPWQVQAPATPEETVFTRRRAFQDLVQRR